MNERRFFGHAVSAICVLAFSCAVLVGVGPAFAGESAQVADGTTGASASKTVPASETPASVTKSADDSKANPAAKEDPAKAPKNDVADTAGSAKTESTTSAASAADQKTDAKGTQAGSTAASSGKEDAAGKDAAAGKDGKQDAKEGSTESLKASEASDEDYEKTHVNAYRLYNPNSGEHFYTTSLNEATKLVKVGWRWEGIGWVSPTSGAPVYRLYNPNSGDHHYTTSATERQKLVKVGWRYEGVGWYSDAKDQSAILRQYNPNAKAGSHNFTSSAKEDKSLGSSGWRREGTAWYATIGPKLNVKAQWLVTSAWGSLERYWLASDGTIAKSRFIDPSEGSGYAAYATGSGAVVRGAKDLGNGYAILADDKGKLASTSDGKTGWLVSKAYTGGLQRYYYDATKKAMRIGFFTVDGKQYYGMSKYGYVLRGKTTYKKNVLIADNDGVLATGTGWLVTDKYDGGKQRYWLVKVSGDYSGAKTGLFTVEKKKYYGNTTQGYVVRNDYVNSGRWYKADNDGVLKESAPPQEAAMLLRAQGFSSSTGYLVMVDVNNCKMGVFTGSKGNWKTARFEDCVTGAPGTPTIRGTYSLGYHLPSLPDWPSARYCTNITGGYFFHSVLGSTSELGQHLSHGCIRLNWPTAQYIQSLPYGSTVNLY